MRATVNSPNLAQKEQKLHSFIVNISTSVSVIISSIIAFSFVPIFPISVSILFGIVLGALAYKKPTWSILLTFVGIVLGFSYQLSLPMSVLICLAIILFIIGLTAIDSISAIRISIGIVAAILTITPLYFVSIPLLLAIPLFGTRNKRITNISAIIVFIALYVLLLISCQENAMTTTILGRCQFSPKQALDVINLKVIFSKIGESISATSAEITLYMDKLSVFFPTFRLSDLLGRMLGLILLAFILGASFVVLGSLSFFEWLEKKLIAPKIISWISAGVSLLFGVVVFLILFIMLSPKLEYINGLVPISIVGMAVCIPLIGASITVIKNWFYRRDLIVDLHENRNKLLSGIPNYIELKPAVLQKIVQDRISVATSWILEAEELTNRRMLGMAKIQYEKTKEYLENTQGFATEHNLGNNPKIVDLINSCMLKMKRITGSMLDRENEDFSVNRTSREKNLAKYKMMEREPNIRSQLGD
jgi:hypothetical protein